MDAAKYRVMSRRDGITECGATEHDVGSRFGGRSTRAGAVLLLAPFDKFGHGGELPCHKADAGLDSAWRQILEGAAKHVPRVVPTAQEVRSVRRKGTRATLRPKLRAPGFPKSS